MNNRVLAKARRAALQQPERKGVGGAIRPPLKWAGGKRWVIPYLSPLWKPHQEREYVEPFCGGLAAALSLRPRSALLNDVNPHLINFYQQIQLGLSFTIEMRNDRQLFYSHRNRFNELVKTGNEVSSETAQLFYYLNRTCFNGLCRFNRSGEFNVPFGRFATVNYGRDLTVLQETLTGWRFTCGDVESLEVDSDAFIYADPPYDVEFRSYSAGGFTWEDQVRTAEWLHRHKGPVVLSNQATDKIVRLYRKLGFGLIYLEGPRRISCTGDRAAANEVLAVKGVQ